MANKQLLGFSNWSYEPIRSTKYKVSFFSTATGSRQRDKGFLRVDIGNLFIYIAVVQLFQVLFITLSGIGVTGGGRA